MSITNLTNKLATSTSLCIAGYMVHTIRKRTKEMGEKAVQPSSGLKFLAV